jgi:HKD family nuclease
MGIFSTRYYNGDNISKLSESTLTRDMRKAQEVSIVSAYYSVRFLNDVFAKILKRRRKNCIVKCVFNGFSGKRLIAQVDELKKFKKDLSENGFENVDIYLNKECQLFHSKIFFIKNEDESLWFIGSANASKSAFNKNEEILMRSLNQIRKIKNYIDLVINSSVSIDDFVVDECIENTLIGFFRTGSLYFKPSNRLSFTFGELKLPSQVEEKLANINERPRNSNPGKAWGPYNLKSALNISDVNDEQKMRLSIKPWSIETCYGYWVPKKYCTIIEEKVVQKERGVDNDLLKIKNKIEEIGVERLIEDYELYISEANDILSKNNIDWVVNEDDKKKLIEKYKRFVERILVKISSSKERERLCKPLISTGMPEIWEDVSASDDFTYSFYEYISNNMFFSTPLIVRCLQYYVEISENAKIEEIEKAFDDYFLAKNAEWSDDHWFDK